MVNLASKEYSKAITPYLTPADRWVTVLFKQEKNGRLVQQATAAKQAQGSLVRYLALENEPTLATIKAFTVGGYRADLSTEAEYVFVKD